MEIQDNLDRKSMPEVDKIATIEVRVILGGDGGGDSERTTVLTFLKEGGKWYKG